MNTILWIVLILTYIWTNISFTTPRLYEICREVHISSLFRPIIRSFVRQSDRPFVNFTSKFCDKPF